MYTAEGTAAAPDATRFTLANEFEIVSPTMLLYHTKLVLS